MTTIYNYVSKFGEYGTDPGQFASEQNGIFISDFIYVVDAVRNQVIKFTLAGVYDSEFTSVRFSSPLCVAVDSTGSIYVANAGSQEVLKFGSDGTYITKWTVTGILGITTDGTYIYTCGVSVSKYSDIGTLLWDTTTNYIEGYGIACDAVVNELVYAINSGAGDLDPVVSSYSISDGAIQGTFGIRQERGGDTCFKDAWAIAVDSVGYIYVTDASSYASSQARVQVFDYTWEYVTSIGRGADYAAFPDELLNGYLNYPFGVATYSTSTATYVFVIDGNYRVTKYSKNDVLVTPKK